jgi:DDE_Tnp_1-associated
MQGLISCFDGLKDHRACNARRHDLLELLVIALCTFLCGGESCVDMADFAEEKEAFLREFLSLSSGLPSHAASTPKPFAPALWPSCGALRKWQKGVVAVEGKTLRGGKGREFDRNHEPGAGDVDHRRRQRRHSVTAHINP